jgi:YidC/Oxa1 family membrane protein insertase
LLDKLSIQARVILATVISFLFFIIFDSFYTPKPVSQVSTQTTQASTANSAPTAQASTDTTTAAQSIAPVTTESTTVLTTVKFNNTVWAIDALGRVANVTLKEAQFLSEDHEGLQLFKEQMTKPLEIRFSDAAVNDEAFKTPYTADQAEVDATATSKKTDTDAKTDGSDG